jgi:carboxypeptidase Q
MSPKLLAGNPLIALFALLPLLAAPASAAETVDLGMVSRIRAEGLEHSQVMDTLFQLTDVIGPRLTGSPQAKEANEWTRQKLASWGLVNAHLEGYPFGRGWSYSRASLRMVVPREVPLVALPKAWTPGTSGPIRGSLLEVKVDTEKDLAAYKGKLAGKILLWTETPRPERRQEKSEEEAPPIQRYSAAELADLGQYEIRGDREEDWHERFLKRERLQKATNELLLQEGVLATVSVSRRANGLLQVSGGGSYEPGGNVGVPAVVLARESYDSLKRLLDAGKKVELELDVAARFHDEDKNLYDTLAEIPGTGREPEVVMAGAHLDSWHGGTGATDNAVGCAVVMEAVRILKALGVKPRRTIRVGLWTGEEEGLLGSIAYVRAHFASRPATTDPKEKELPEDMRKETWPITPSAEHAKLSAYFNLDNGGGRVRGVYAQQNAAARPIFEAWLAPLKDLGADTVTLRDTSSTDHISFDRVGLPGFQFIQDELDYSNRTHHTNLDVYDRVNKKDLMQASVVLATFLYDAAMRPEPFPRKPLPTAPPEKEKKKEEGETEEGTKPAAGR